MLKTIETESGIDLSRLVDRFNITRIKSELLTKSLDESLLNLQFIAETSPLKWHLAHSSWFYEQVILKKIFPSYKEFESKFNYQFNSYYNSFGDRQARDQRYQIKISLKEVLNYRNYINKAISDYCFNNSKLEFSKLQEIYKLIELGINHEEQHQELMLTDIKYSLYVYNKNIYFKPNTNHLSFQIHAKAFWVEFDKQLIGIGFGDAGFAFDNEKPMHQYMLYPYKISSQLVTNAEYLEFIESNGYFQPEFWLSDGWDFIQRQNIHAPLYWFKENNEWHIYTLSGISKLNLHEPVSHISFYEADAFARWKGARLPTEQEWENFACNKKIKGNFLESNLYHPIPTIESMHCCGDLWQFTSSSYSPYPGYKAPSGELAEYNSKFMINQVVLRGGSCATPEAHYRHSYRNFFYPHQRWQFMGIRLAQD